MRSFLTPGLSLAVAPLQSPTSLVKSDDRANRALYTREPVILGCALMDSRLLELLVCPVAKTSLVYKRDRSELWSRGSGLAYPIVDDIPVLLEAEARTLTDAEKASLADPNT